MNWAESAQRNSDRVWALGGTKRWRRAQKKKKRGSFQRHTHKHHTVCNTHTHTHMQSSTQNFNTCVRAPTNTHTHTHTSHPVPFPGLWLPPRLSFWLFLFQQSQLITPYCCRQLQTTTNLEFHYSKLFHMCMHPGPRQARVATFQEGAAADRHQPPSCQRSHTAIVLFLAFFHSPFIAVLQHINIFPFPTPLLFIIMILTLIPPPLHRHQISILQLHLHYLNFDPCAMVPLCGIHTKTRKISPWA